MNITLQDPRRCQSKQNSFAHQQDKHAKRRVRGRRGGKVRGGADKKKEERLFKKGMGGKWLIGNAESETST